MFDQGKEGGGLAILVVDMISGCINEEGRVRDQDELQQQIHAIGQLLTYAGTNIPIFFAEYNPTYGPTIPEITHCAYKPVVIYKRWGSAFYDTDLHHYINLLETDTLVLTGINLSSCVYSTAKDAQHLGLEVVTSLDLITDFEHENSEWEPFKNRELHYFQENTTLFPTYKEVIKFIDN